MVKLKRVKKTENIPCEFCSEPIIKFSVHHVKSNLLFCSLDCMHNELNRRNSVLDFGMDLNIKVESHLS